MKKRRLPGPRYGLMQHGKLLCHSPIEAMGDEEARDFCLSRLEKYPGDHFLVRIEFVERIYQIANKAPLFRR